MNNNLLEMKVTTKTITPALAKKYLDNNAGNRKLTDRHVVFLASQMQQGLWQDTGDTIKIGKSGKLIDGQHRLSAVIKYGKPLDFVVAEGVADRSFTSIDTGKTRSAGDLISMQGYKYPTMLAGAIRSILNFESGYFSQDSSSRNGKARSTNEQVLKFLKQNEEQLTEIIPYCFAITNKFKFLNTSALGCLYWILSQKHVKLTEEFFELYAETKQKEKSPMYFLKEKLMQNYNKRSKYSGRDKMALFIEVWNMYRRGTTKIESLTLANNYVFPKPI